MRDNKQFALYESWLNFSLALIASFLVLVYNQVSSRVLHDSRRLICPQWI